MSKHALAIAIPMFNEAVGAARCAQKVLTAIQKVSTDILVIFIDDGSSDDTLRIITEIQTQYPKQIKVLSHGKNKGYGAALETGIRYAALQKYEYLLCMDSDLTNNPKFIKDFYAQIPAHYDCVKASRYIFDGRMEGVELHRQIISRTGNYIASKLFGMGIHDCTNGFRMLKVSLIRKLKYRERGFASILEELLFLKRNHAKMKEIPTVLTARKKTKTHFIYNPATFWNYLKYALAAVLA